MKDHEPRVALDGGPDGLAFYRRIAAEAGRFVRPGGALLLEVGHTQNDAVRVLLAGRPEWAVGESVRDLGGRWRVVAAQRAGG